VGGAKYDTLIEGGDIWGVAKGYQIILGDPPNASGGDRAKKENIMWQRMRLFQVERIIDGMVELSRKGVLGSRKQGVLIPTDLRPQYRALHLDASLELLEFFPRFTRANPYRDWPLYRRVLSVILSAIAENSDQPGKAKAAVEKVLQQALSPELRVYRRGDEPRGSGATLSYPWVVVLSR